MNILHAWSSASLAFLITATAAGVAPSGQAYPPCPGPEAPQGAVLLPFEGSVLAVGDVAPFGFSVKRQLDESIYLGSAQRHPLVCAKGSGTSLQATAECQRLVSKIRRCQLGNGKEGYLFNSKCSGVPPEVFTQFGHEIILDDISDTKVFQELNNVENRAEVRLVADTVTVRSRVRLPQSDVVVHARILKFEGDGAFDTSPHDTWTEAAQPAAFCNGGDLPTLPWVDNHVARRKCENGDVPPVRPEGANGEPGMDGGNLTLAVQKIATDDSSKVRFFSHGGQGQEGGDGRDGLDGVDLQRITNQDVTNACAGRGMSNCASLLVDVPAAHRTNMVFFSYYYKQYGGFAPVITDFSASQYWFAKAPREKWDVFPSDGLDALAPGLPGRGGAAGQIYQSVGPALAIEQTAGSIPSQQHRHLKGGRATFCHAVKPCSTGQCPVDVTGDATGECTAYFERKLQLRLTEESKVIRPGNDATEEQFAHRFSVVPELNTPPLPRQLTPSPQDIHWLTSDLANIAAQVSRDLHKYGDLERAITIADVYLDAVSAEHAAQDPRYFNAVMELTSTALSARRGDDFYGRPLGYVPLESLQVLLPDYESAIRAYGAVLGLDEWISDSEANRLVDAATLRSVRAATEQALAQSQAEVRSHAAAIEGLRSEATKMANTLSVAASELTSLELQLLFAARQNVDRRHEKIRRMGQLKTLVVAATTVITTIATANPAAGVKAGIAAGTAFDVASKDEHSLGDVVTLYDAVEKSGVLDSPDKAASMQKDLESAAKQTDVKRAEAAVAETVKRNVGAKDQQEVTKVALAWLSNERKRKSEFSNPLLTVSAQSTAAEIARASAQAGDGGLKAKVEGVMPYMPVAQSVLDVVNSTKPSGVASGEVEQELQILKNNSREYGRLTETVETAMSQSDTLRASMLREVAAYAKAIADTHLAVNALYGIDQLRSHNAEAIDDELVGQLHALADRAADRVDRVASDLSRTWEATLMGESPIQSGDRGLVVHIKSRFDYDKATRRGGSANANANAFVAEITKLTDDLWKVQRDQIQSAFARQKKGVRDENFPIYLPLGARTTLSKYGSVVVNLAALVASDDPQRSEQSGARLTSVVITKIKDVDDADVASATVSIRPVGAIWATRVSSESGPQGARYLRGCRIDGADCNVSDNLFPSWSTTWSDDGTVGPTAVPDKLIREITCAADVPNCVTAQLQQAPGYDMPMCIRITPAPRNGIPSPIRKVEEFQATIGVAWIEGASVGMSGGKP